MVSQLQRRQHQSQSKVFLGAERVKSSNGQDTVPVNFNHLEARLEDQIPCRYSEPYNWKLQLLCSTQSGNCCCALWLRKRCSQRRLMIVLLPRRFFFFVIFLFWYFPVKRVRGASFFASPGNRVASELEHALLFFSSLLHAGRPSIRSKEMEVLR